MVDDDEVWVIGFVDVVYDFDCEVYVLVCVVVLGIGVFVGVWCDEFVDEVVF